MKVNETVFSQRNLNCSVPQGSCLGHWLYLTYAGTLFDIIPPNISVFGFADDHTSILRFKHTSAEEEEAAIHALQEWAVIIYDWINASKLKMNTSKTEFIMFGSRQQLDKCSTHEILVCGDNIELQKLY